MRGLKLKAVQFLEKFSYSNKIKLILILSVIAIGISAGVVYKIRVDMLNNIIMNSYGIQYYRALSKLMHHVIDHELTVYSVLENEEAKKSADLAEIEVDRSLGQLERIHADLGTKLFASSFEDEKKFTLSLKKFEDNWKYIKEQGLNIKKQRSNTLHRQLITILRSIISDISYASGLPLNHDIASQRVINALVDHLIDLYSIIPNLIFLEVKLSEDEALTFRDKVQLHEFETSLKSQTEKIVKNIDAAYRSNNRLREMRPEPAAATTLEMFSIQMDRYIELIEENFRTEELKNRIMPQELIAIGGKTLSYTYALNQSMIGQLLQLLQIQQNTIHFKQKVGLAWCVFSIAALLAFYSTRVIRRPVADLKNAAKKLESGNLSARIQVTANDEVAMMSHAFNRMAAFFEGIIVDAKQITSHLVSTASVIFSTAQKLEHNISEQEESIYQIAKNSKGISRTVQDFADYLVEVNKAFSTTSELALVGRKDIIEMQSIMQQMVENSNSIVAMLNDLEEKVGAINRVIYAIVKIADQANLLSLNAAIRADKTGQRGIGFSVIAVKIRELADQTAYVTLDIEDKMKGIINAVSETSRVVQDFSQQVCSQVTDSSKISEQLQQLIRVAEEQIKSFEEINKNMQKQAARSQLIYNEANTMIAISKQTTNSVQQLYHEIEYLYHATNNLEEVTKKFKESHKSQDKDEELSFQIEV